MRVVEKKVENRRKTVKNYRKKVEERKNACSREKVENCKNCKKCKKCDKSQNKKRVMEKI